MNRALLTVCVLLALATPAWACPSCSLSQDVDTLVFILAFMITPYIIVSGTWAWMRRILKRETV